MRKTSVGSSPLRHDSSRTRPRRVLPFVYPQPAPRNHKVIHYRFARKTWTFIQRFWNQGDTPRCRLCRACTADADGCTIVIPEFVSRDDAILFSVVGRPLQKPIGGEA